MKAIRQKSAVWFVTILAFLICSGSTFAQSPSFSTSASAVPACGQLDDGLVHVPPSYNSFTPPAEGQGYVDPQYGCTVTRLTDSTHDSPIVPRHHYYSTLTPFNANSSEVMVFLDNGSNEIRDIRGNIVVPVANMPGSNTGVEPWDPITPNVFYYVNGNQFLKGTISGTTVVSTVLHTFSAYSQVVIPDEEDLTDDGTKIWLIGNPGNECAGTGILYDHSTDTVVSQSLILNSCHKVQIFPSGKMLCTNCNGNNITIYNTDGSIYWNPPYTATAHAEVGTDLQGREVLIHTANGTASLNACADPWNSLTVVDINAKAPVNCLINGIPPWHVSYRDSSAGWVALSFFDQGTCPDYSCFFPQNLTSNWTGLWSHYAEEVIVVKIDGSKVQRLVHHRSRSAEYYWAQSHAAISRDGKFVLFDSNMDISNSGFVSPNQYSDVYLTSGLTTSSLMISPATITLNAGGAQTFSVSGGVSPYTYSMVTNNSGGTINASTGAYIAGTIGGVTDTLQVTDTVGNTSTATVRVRAPLVISPASVTVSTGGSQAFSASGGVSPYTYSIATNNSGGTINASTGAYVAGTRGGVTDTVQVTDSSGNASTAIVTVRAATLVISPASVSVSIGGSQVFGASGGVSPYTYSIATNNSGGTINASTGAYVTGTRGGVTDTVRVTDSGGNTSAATVTVRAPLVISPASVSVSTGGSQAFSASGGVSPYTYSIATNNSGGTINVSTGAYIAGAKAGVTDTVRVIDTAGSISNAVVTVKASGCATIAKVQVVSPGSASTASRSASLTETASNLLVAVVYWNGSDVAGISDRLGNTWNSVPVQDNAATATDVRIWYAQNIKGGANTVTVTQPWSVTLGFYLIEYSGIATTNALDVASGKIATAASRSLDTGNLTTTGCRDLVVGLFADTWGSGTMTPGSGWISRGADTNFYSTVVDNVPGGTGTFDPKASLAGSNSDSAWAATAAAFKAKQ
ncbi:MAG TPA: hypothetical protein VK738_12840 [Terriglobales bacterium]|nr:hypothetical protein [Terriglobales bacterium]